MSSAAAPQKRYASVARSARRVWELDLGSAALVMAAQQLMCTIPLLVVLSAIHPASASANFGEQLARYLGLSATAAHELKAVFARDAQVRTATSIVGLIMLALFALGTAQAHERVYELAWRLDGRGAGGWHRRIRWVAALVGYVALVAGAGRLLGTGSSRWEFLAVCAPVTALFFWWGQRTLLAGRIPARALVPGALLIATGSSALLAVSPVAVSGQLSSSVREFGAIGVTFVLATWLLVLSALIVTGAVIGAEIAFHCGHAARARYAAQPSAEARRSPTNESS